MFGVTDGSISLELQGATQARAFKPSASSRLLPVAAASSLPPIFPLSGSTSLTFSARMLVGVCEP